MKRSKFSLSHYRLLTCNMGELVPIGLLEVLPGDSIQHSTSLLVRVSPLLSPVMHPVRVRVHHWFIPHRINWDDWESFITGGPDGMDASTFPTISAAGPAEGSLSDYLGVPPGFVGSVSALPYRAYVRTFNEWYRDQDLVTALALSTASGVDGTTYNTALVNAAWEKDYFTSARPWTQKGPEISISLATSAPVTPDGAGAGPTFKNVGTTGNFLRMVNAQAGVDWSATPSGTSANASWDDPNLVADLTGASAVTINALREAFALQRYEEARARYGSRYVEYLRYLGVRSSDARLQRPEYLGGGRQTIQFSEVLQSAPDADTGTSEDFGVGALKGHGIGAMRSNRYRRFFEEHGYILSLMSVLPRTMYMDGLSRTWNRRTKEDFFQKELQHIGQQEILNKEIYAVGASPDGTFGYQDRYDEYRRMESGISGEFRSTLNFWHYARSFAAAPSLNSSFVTADPTKRVNAVPSTDCLWVMANHSIQARRIVAGRGSSFTF